jgi:hypothetical protein
MVRFARITEFWIGKEWSELSWVFHQFENEFRRGKTSLNVSAIGPDADVGASIGSSATKKKRLGNCPFLSANWNSGDHSKAIGLLAGLLFSNEPISCPVLD